MSRAAALLADDRSAQAALAASQADHQETQRRISKLQEGLSVIDFPEHNGNDAAQVSASGCDVGKDGCAAGGEGLAPEEKPRGDLHQLHRITPVRAPAVPNLNPGNILPTCFYQLNEYLPLSAPTTYFACQAKL